MILRTALPVLLILMTGTPIAIQDVRELVPGTPIEREMSGGETHSYRVTLASGRYLSVIVEQQGIELSVLILGPDGGQITRAYNTGAQGSETISVVAEASGG